MDDTDAILSEDLDTDTQMDPTNGRGSPVIAQTPQTKARESERSKKRGTIPARKRGVGRCGRVNADTRSRNSGSRSPPPQRPVDERVPAATSSTSRSRSRSPPPETPVADSQRGRERVDRSQRAEARSATLDAATNALNRARENRARSPTRSRSPSENPSSTPATVESRGRKKSSIIWNHCTQKTVNNVKVTYCSHCSSSWTLSGSTSTALQHLRTIHADFITEAEENQLNSVSEPSTPIRRGRKKSSMIWNHCTQKIVDGIKYTCCKHCSSQWNLNGSTSTALQHIRLVHTDLI